MRWAVFAALIFASGCTSTDGGGVTISFDDLAGPGDGGAPPGDLALIVETHQVPGVAVTTLAGSDVAGSADGTGAMAQFNNPVSVAFDANGLLWVAEYDGNRIRTLTTAGDSATVFAGETGFDGPFGLLPRASGEVLVQTDFDPTGVKDVSTGTLWTLSGGAVTPILGGMGRPRGLAPLYGNVVIADHTRETLSILDASGAIHPLTGVDGEVGLADGPPAVARFNSPLGVAALPDGKVVVADSDNHCLRVVASDGTVTTLAGDGNRGVIDGPRTQARFVRPIAVAVDASGVIYVSDQGDAHRIRRVILGQVETLAGDGTAGFADGAGDLARFYGQEGIAISPDGHTLFVADGNSGDGSAYHRIRAITIP
jgi:DNA-binding beta-propeller fold protein YncE